MKTEFNLAATALGIIILATASPALSAQPGKAFVKKYMTEFPAGKAPEGVLKYRMTAVYTNRDLYGKFMNKSKISGDYTRGLPGGQVEWGNVYLAGSAKFEEPFGNGTKQEYFEKFRYVPSEKTLEKDFFSGVPSTPDAVLAKNLVWDMMMIENFAWKYADSLEMNQVYRIPEIEGEFQMGDIGNYSHVGIQICWTGISWRNRKLCAVVEYRALDNKLELDIDPIKSKGTEQYWGTTWISLEDSAIEYAEIYGGTIQEIEVKGLSQKMIIKSIRELWVEKIK